MKMGETFKRLRTFVIVRNLFFLLFKISLSIIFIILIAIISFIALLSAKPRNIPSIDNYVIKKFSNLKNVEINFNKDNSVLFFDLGLGLQYQIKDLSIIFKENKLDCSEVKLNFDFSDLLFGKINLNSINLNSGLIKVNTKNNIQKNKIKKKDLITNFKKKANKVLNSSVFVNQFSLNNFNIILNNDNNNIINIIYIDFETKKQKQKTLFSQNILFNINKNNLNSNLKLNCERDKKNNLCKITLNNINFNEYKYFFQNNITIYNYLNNINGNFNFYFKFNLDKKLNLKEGQFNTNSKYGSFYLKQFFDEKLLFNNLNLNLKTKNNFEEIKINSLTANFEKTNLNLNLKFNKNKEYNNLNLNIGLLGVRVENLKKFWPNVLGRDEGIRPWVIEHFFAGDFNKASARMNFKYFKDKKKKNFSGLQKIYSEVEFKNLLLEYSDYFPKISKIDGVAIFTEKDMNIKVNSGKVLKSDIKNANIFIDFKKEKPRLLVNSRIKGLFSDLFVHINKEDEKNIRSNVNNIIEDYFTDTQFKLNIPISDEVNFENSGINVVANLFNKKNFLLKNSVKIPIFFNKPINSNQFFGKINLTNAQINYLPLNLDKIKNKSLILKYKAKLEKDNIVRIFEFEPLENYISFNSNGFLDIDKKRQDINIKNIKYNGSDYNINFKSHTKNDKIYNFININGTGINYKNILNKIKNLEIKKENNKTINSETIINLSLDYLSFNNKQKLFGPITTLKLKNNKVTFLDFIAGIDKEDKYIRADFNKKTNMFTVESNNFGRFFGIIELTDRVKNGSGKININQKYVDNKSIVFGHLNIEKEFSIVTNNKLKENVLSNVEKDKNFKSLQKGLVNENSIIFDKMRGEFEYYKDVINLKEVVANSNFIKLQILASGFVNTNSGEIKIKGLLMPLSFINGLFGINKLPVISSLIFGGKDAGLFASKFEVNKQNNNEETKLKIDKFSMILPGFLRNIFDKSIIEKVDFTK